MDQNRDIENSAESAHLRREMVDSQIRSRRINNEPLLEAMAAVPRELFVPEPSRGRALGDFPLPIGHAQTISQPYIVARMIDLLDCGPQSRVLDVGAGSGYQTAILSHLAGEVFGIERIEALRQRAESLLAKLRCTNVVLTAGDGSLGWEQHAPYDGIICGAAAPEVPKSWIGQLADGGRIVVPVGDKFTQKIIVVQRIGDQLERKMYDGVRFVHLIGEQGYDS